MTRSARRFAKRWGRLAVLVATVCAFLSAQLQVELHDALVEHVVCAEHGGQVEDMPRAMSGARSERVSKVAHAAPDAPSEHQACEMPPGLLSGVVAVSAPTVLHPVAISFLDPQPPEGVLCRTGPPLLQEAPKLSPPRA